MLTFDIIENLRVMNGLTIGEVCRRAGMTQPNQYYRYRAGTVRARPAKLRLLKEVIEGRSWPRRPMPSKLPEPMFRALIASTYRGFLAVLAREQGLDPEAVAASQPSLSKVSDPAWLAAARVRALAVYCTCVELDVPGRRVAQAAGMTKQAVSECLKRVEDLRDDPAIDALVERVSRLISGRVE